MALEDKDIFMAICNRYTDQPIEFIMEEYEKAKKMNLEIEKKIKVLKNGASAPEPQEQENPEASPEDANQVQRKRFTKKSVKFPPETAIKKESITCCLCGAELQSLTSKHLAMHGISTEDYKKICGYAPDQKLMSEDYLLKSKDVIKKAQSERMKKRAAKQEAKQ